ncbi:MAG: CheR family methyltransferase [Bacteroidota bacterium]
MSLTYEEFKKEAAALTGVDLTAYKSQQMDRRLHSLMGLWGVATYDEYLHALRTDEARFNEFQKKLTINVSEFFRNPERFEELNTVVLPELFQAGRPLRIWSAGCSNGAEAYTLAILIKESGFTYGARILGTDIDRESLRRAHLGVYTQNEVRCVPPHILERYFTADDRSYRLAERIKVMVDFKFHNLLHGRFDGQYDLILCRNVVIYLTEAAKDELYRKLCAVLRPGGYLMVGGTEPLLNFKEFGLENPLTAFYRKLPPAAPGKLGQAVR